MGDLFLAVSVKSPRHKAVASKVGMEYEGLIAVKSQTVNYATAFLKIENYANRSHKVPQLNAASDLTPTQSLPNMHSAWGSSSVWQSAAFAMRRSGVRSPSAPPVTHITP